MGRIGREISHAVHDIGHAASSAVKTVGSTISSVAEGVGKVASAGIGAAKNVFENVAHGVGNILEKALKTGIGIAGGALNPLNFFQGLMGKNSPLGLLGGILGGPAAMLGGLLGGKPGGLPGPLGGILGGGGGPLGVLGGLLGGGNGPGGLLGGLPPGILGGPIGLLGGAGGPEGPQGVLTGLLKNLDGAFKTLQDPGFRMQDPLQGLAEGFNQILGSLPNPMNVPPELLLMQNTLNDVSKNFDRMAQGLMGTLRG